MTSTDIEMEIELQNGSGGTSDYNDLKNKPSINGVSLLGNKTLSALGIQPKGEYVEDALYVHTDNNYTTDEKEKLSTLNNYDDTSIKLTLASKQDKLTAGTNIVIEDGVISATGGGTGGSGTTNYEDLYNKPQINSVRIVGNKSLEELGIQPAGDYATKEYVDNAITTTITEAIGGSY